MRLIIFIIFMSITSPFGVMADEQTNSEPPLVILDDNERRYLASKKEITFCIDTDWMPFEAIRHGRLDGMTSDFQLLFQKMLDIPFRFVPTDGWAQSQEFAKAGKCDILPMVSITPKRKKFLTFTNSYLGYSAGIIAKNDLPFISNLGDLKNFPVGIIRGSSIWEYTSQNFLHNTFVAVNGVEEALLKVSSGEIKAFLIAVPVAVDSINSLGITNLKLAGLTENRKKLRIGISKQSPLLTPIIVKLVETLQREDVDRIYSKWLILKLEHGLNYNLLWKFGAVLAILLVVVGGIVFTIHRINRRLVRSSQKLAIEVIERKQAEKRQRIISSSLQQLTIVQDNLLLPGELRDKLNQVTDLAVDTLVMDFCRVWLIRPGDLCESSCIHAKADPPICLNRYQCLHLTTSSGRYTNLDGDHQRVPLGVYKIGIIATGEEEYFLTNDVVHDPRVHNHQWAQELGLVSFAGYKLQDSNGICTGVLAMFAQHTIADDESSILRALSQSLSNVIIANSAEEAIRGAKVQAENANNAKSNFLAHMSHEIRTPLNAILGMNEVLTESELSLEQRNQLKIASNAGETLLALINDVLDLSKIEAGQIDLAIIDFNLHKLIENTANLQSLAAHEKGINFDIEQDRGIPKHVKGDPDRLRQVLLNLLNNAIKFTSSGSVVCNVTQEPEHRINFTVRDTGIGISPEHQEQIFKPFVQADATTTRNFGGTGLGLTICKQLVETMGGTIEVESQLEVGSTFHVILPLPPSKLHHSLEIQDGPVTTQVSVKSEPAKEVLNILLVDDAEENRMVIAAYLRHSPHHIIETENGAEAIEVLKDKEIDLVLMDMLMPVMDGYDATRVIREQETASGSKPIPIIALTAQALKEDLQKTIDAGCDFHLTKPVRKTQLIEAIDRFRH
jgi:signal transduction histidine kinase/CheY-like chemotaxis protein/ABC-type amino acid transport substrate-binding protein